MVLKDLHPENVCSSIRDTPSGITMETSEEHPEKEYIPMLVIVDGRTIDSNALQFSKVQLAISIIRLN